MVTARSTSQATAASDFRQHFGTGARVLVVGLGKTGLSCARYLSRQGLKVTVADTRESPPELAHIREAVSDVVLMLGPDYPRAFESVERILLSPGVSLDEPEVACARQKGIPVIGDVELFAQVVNAPVVAITGSNGKSTVTTLVGLMAQAAGRRVAIGGNLGEPVLDLLDPANALYVLELSSFQLETTASLALEAAALLNLSPDHLDRYPNFAAYAAAKARIFRHAAAAVVNRDDAPAEALASAVARQIGFTLGPPRAGDFGIRMHDGADWICHGHHPLMPSAELVLPGRHNLANALAALALIEHCGIPLETGCQVLREFGGLPHRSEVVAQKAGIRWVNDSKGTNPGATAAALIGLSESRSPGSGSMHVAMADDDAGADASPSAAGGRSKDAGILLIAGGDCKGADFSVLRDAVRDHARALILIGRDAPILAESLRGTVTLYSAVDLDAAVELAAGLAQPGDTVLLSPACASFDMFDDYQHRGRCFVDAVKRLTA